MINGGARERGKRGWLNVWRASDMEKRPNQPTRDWDRLIALIYRESRLSIAAGEQCRAIT